MKEKYQSVQKKNGFESIKVLNNYNLPKESLIYFLPFSLVALNTVDKSQQIKLGLDDIVNSEISNVEENKSSNVDVTTEISDAISSFNQNVNLSQNSNTGYGFKNNSIQSESLGYGTDSSYVPSNNYTKQQWEQIWDFSRNAEAKRIHVHFSAEDIGAWAYTTLTDRNIVFNESLLSTDPSFRKMVKLHETRHRPTEYETERVIESSLVLGPIQENYKDIRVGK